MDGTCLFAFVPNISFGIPADSKKHEVYMCDIEFKYKFALLVQGSMFQMFYNFVFAFFDENHTMYGWDAYAVFLSV